MISGRQPARRTLRCGASRQHAVNVAKQLYVDVWSKGDIGLLQQIMADDHSQCDMVWQPDRQGGGRERMEKGIAAFRKAYPDLEFTVQDIATTDTGDAAFVHWTVAGTNTGPLGSGPATGQPMQFSGVSLLRLNEQGKIRQSIVYRQTSEGEAQSVYAARTKGTGEGQAQPAAGQ